ncbi:solute carrier family 49 member 4-like [Haliotis rufescens]|uniref:solute carrier family 49 member 4-like n=1 Tax=Haliotis rufescens TaxID=6454 RepID=UPI00201F1B14|nr:solute carrier family 49 member 4-like [Haliotis rufescens]
MKTHDDEVPVNANTRNDQGPANEKSRDSNVAANEKSSDSNVAANEIPHVGKSPTDETESPTKEEVASSPNVTPDIKVYKRRWYILALFSLMAGLQAGVWNQWGPIARTSERMYGWTDSDIALLANWGPIMFLPSCLAWSWLLDTKGLRPTCLLASALIAAGTGVRCITQSQPTFTWLVHTGHILNGLAGPIGKGGVAKLSAVWFPREERTTSTTIGFVVIGLSLGLTFLVGPLLVPEMKTFPTNATFSSFDNVTYHVGNTTVADAITEHKRTIAFYLYGTFAVCAFLFLLMCVYFPNSPPHPPSVSASKARMDYVAGLKHLARKRRFWQIAVAYGLSTGTRDVWGFAMLDVNLKAHGISQADAGWLGFYGFLAAAATGIIVGRFADRFQRRLRLILVLLDVLALLSFLWMILLILNIIPRTREELYAANIVKSVVNGADSPLFFELVCEVSYPVAEGITNLSLTAFNNVASLIFLGVLSIRNIGTVWMNWFLIAAFSVSIMLLVLLGEGRKRSDVDVQRREHDEEK